MVQFFTKNFSKKGFSLVEILFAMVLFTIFSAGIFSLSVSTIQRDARVQVDNEGLRYAQEGIEATRQIRDQNFLLLTNGTYGLTLTSDAWSFGTSPETIDSYYSRNIIVEDVLRDTSGDIATSGTIDPNMKKATARVTWLWKGVDTRNVTLVTYLSNWRSLDLIQTTCTDFDAGTYSSTEKLTASSPPADNCTVALTLASGMSDFFQDVDIGDHGRDVVVDGNIAYVATDDSNEGLAVVDVTDPDNTVILDTLDIDGRGRKIEKSGNYVYVGVNDNNEGLAVVDVSDPNNVVLVDQVDVTDNGNQIEISGNYLYMGVDDDDDSFRIYDISSPASPSFVSSLDLGEEVQRVHLDGNYAYLGMDDDDAFTVVDISNVNSPSLVADIDLDDEVKAIELLGNVAYVGIDDDDDGLQVVDISDPANPNIITELDLDGNIRDIAYIDGQLYVTLHESQRGLAVVDVSSPLAPSFLFHRDIQGKGHGLDVDDGHVYITLHEGRKGLILVEKINPGYPVSGTFTSSAVDTTATDTRYNFLEWESTAAVGGSIAFQIKTADTSSNLSSATWVGPDGTNSTFYTVPRTAIILDSSASGSRWFQYQISFTSNTVFTPSVESVTLNYNL